MSKSQALGFPSQRATASLSIPISIIADNDTFSWSLPASMPGLNADRSISMQGVVLEASNEVM